MPYILAILGALLALFGLYHFMMNANPRQIKSLLLSVTVLAVAVAVLLLALTGRLPAAFGLIAGVAPFALAFIRGRSHAHRPAQASPRTPESTSELTDEDALEILGLSADATIDEIQAAYKRLMKAIHPDQQGSPWMAERLNAARDRLLKGR